MLDSPILLLFLLFLPFLSFLLPLLLYLSSIGFVTAVVKKRFCFFTGRLPLYIILKTRKKNIFDCDYNMPHAALE